MQQFSMNAFKDLICVHMLATQQNKGTLIKSNLICIAQNHNLDIISPGFEQTIQTLEPYEEKLFF